MRWLIRVAVFAVLTVLTQVARKASAKMAADDPEALTLDANHIHIQL